MIEFFYFQIWISYRLKIWDQALGVSTIIIKDTKVDFKLGAKLGVFWLKNWQPWLKLWLWGKSTPSSPEMALVFESNYEKWPFCDFYGLNVEKM